MTPKPLHGLDSHLLPLSYHCIPATLLTLLSYPKHRKSIRFVPLAAPLAWNSLSLAFLHGWLSLII